MSDWSKLEGKTCFDQFCYTDMKMTIIIIVFSSPQSVRLIDTWS